MTTFEELGRRLDEEFGMLHAQVTYLSEELQKQQEKDADIANLLRALADRLEDKKY
jgi:hypothetical protein